MIWIGRLLLLEYALPSQRYSTLDWPARDYYEDYNWRLENVRREYMLEGCQSPPVGNMISLMAYGKYVTKQLGRTGLITWDSDGQGFQIKDKRVTMTGYKSMVHGIVLEAKEIMDRELLFGAGRMTLDLANMQDIITERRNGFSLLEDEREGGYDTC
jgi:hypothetical protein